MIRFDQNYSKEINRIVKNFNAKISRLEKKGTPSYLLPSREKARLLKKEYKTINRRELNIKLRELQAFSKRGVEKPVKLETGRVTKYHLHLMKKRRNRIIRQKRAELKQAEANLKPFDYIGRSKMLSLKGLLKKLMRPFDSREALSSFNTEYQKEYSPHRKNVFYQNFFTALFKDAEFINYSKDKLEEIKESISKFTPDQLIELSENSPLISGIMDYYNVEDDNSISNLFDNLYAFRNELAIYLA